jgi:hypothetical protein
VNTGVLRGVSHEIHADRCQMFLLPVRCQKSAACSRTRGVTPVCPRPVRKLHRPLYVGSWALAHPFSVGRGAGVAQLREECRRQERPKGLTARGETSRRLTLAVEQSVQIKRCRKALRLSRAPRPPRFVTSDRPTLSSGIARGHSCDPHRQCWGRSSDPLEGKLYLARCRERLSSALTHGLR